MVDVSEKDDVPRLARAGGEIVLSEETIKMIKAGNVEKGNVLATARVAAILAIKRTSEIIPLCHQIPITGIDVDFKIENVVISTVIEVRTVGKTGSRDGGPHWGFGGAADNMDILGKVSGKR